MALRALVAFCCAMSISGSHTRDRVAPRVRPFPMQPFHRTEAERRQVAVDVGRLDARDVRSSGHLMRQLIDHLSCLRPSTHDERSMERSAPHVL